MRGGCKPYLPRIYAPIVRNNEQEFLVVVLKHCIQAMVEGYLFTDKEVIVRAGKELHILLGGHEVIRSTGLDYLNFVYAFFNEPEIIEGGIAYIAVRQFIYSLL